MPLAALAFLVGVMTLPWFSVIPSLWWFFPAFIVAALLWYFSHQPYRIMFKFLLIALLGCVFVLWRSEKILQWQLPENLETKNLMKK